MKIKIFRNGLCCVLYFLLAVSCIQKSTKIEPYGHSGSLKEPKKFFPEEVTTMNGISFSKDGSTLYTSQPIDNQFDNGRNKAGIFVQKFRHGAWSKPEHLIFESGFDAYHPTLSVDNQTLYFNSRTLPGSPDKSIPHNIWSLHWNGSNWTDPHVVDSINSEYYDSYPSITNNNNIYFNSDRPGGKGGMDIYVSRFKDGHHRAPSNILTINSTDAENDLVVDPQERFIIFNRYFHSTGELDLFISFYKNNEWTQPRPLDNINTPENWELTPTLSPDGSYFFYELDQKVMQIELSALIYPDELPSIGKRQL